MPEDDFPLPAKIPPGWLEDIKAVVQSANPRLWVVLLGSSVVAAVIAVGPSYLANRSLEKFKTRLELKRDNVRLRVAAYNKLSQNLGVFADRLQGFGNLVEIASHYPLDRGSLGHIQHELRGVGQAEHDVEIARNDPVLKDSLVQNRINECLRQLNPVLAGAKLHPVASVPPVQAASIQIRSIVSEITVEISNDIDSIR